MEETTSRTEETIGRAQGTPDGATAGETVLEVEGLSYAYKGCPNLFEGIGFTLRRGEILCILGSNGSGKSTLLNCVSGVFRANGGSVRLLGEDVYGLPAREVARHISYVQQVHAASFGFKVDDYLLMGRSPYIKVGSAPGEEDWAIVRDVMGQLGIEEFAEKSFNELSGGERQQVQIARALVQRTEVIMLDEPTNHLDFGNQLKVLQLLKRLSREGYAIVLTTHMPDHAILLDGTVGVLDRSHRLSVGTARDMVTEDALKAIYNVDLDVYQSEHLGRRVCAYRSLEEDGR